MDSALDSIAVETPDRYGLSGRSARAGRWGVMVVGLAALSFGCSSAHSAGVHEGGRQASHTQSRRPSQVAVSVEDEPAERFRCQIGRSVNGRRLWAYHRGDPDSPRSLLLVGCIHGNESAGIAIARLVVNSRPAGEANVWVIPDLNPDG